MISCSVDSDENREEKLLSLRLLLTNIRDFLCIRGFSAVLIDPSPSSTSTKSLKEFGENIQAFS